MSESLWQQTDAYLDAVLDNSDPILEAALQDSEQAGLPAINVSAQQGQLLNQLARINRARRILEIGTLGGYSTIWLARALPADGSLITLESRDGYAQVARRNLERAGLADRVQVQVGNAIDSLAAMDREKMEPFDFVFIDADKPRNPAYLTQALRLTSPGAMIVVDNVVRAGRIADAQTDAPAIVATRRMFSMIQAHPGLTASVIQTVGVKGYDGFCLITVE